MKKFWVLLAVLSLVIGAAGLTGCTQGTIAQGATGFKIINQQEGIWVSGYGSVFAAPDIASLRLGIEAQASTVAEAQDQAATAMNAVVQALTDNGIASKDVQTQQFSIQRVTRYDNDTQKEVLIGYRVTNIVAAKIRAIDKVGQVIDAVAAAGGDLTRIDGIAFSLEDPTKVLESARQKAMADAQAKASQLANLGGVTLGKATYINESSQGPTPIGMAVPAPIMSRAATPISGGELEFVVNVQIVYSIID